MEILRTAINKVSGLRYMIEKLDIKSGLGKRRLLATEFIVDENQIKTELSNISEMLKLISYENEIISNLQFKLEQIRDIQGTLNNISKAGVLDDIEFFEVKRFCLLENEIKQLLENLNFTIIILPTLEKVIDILDPENQRLAHFYINPLYSTKLASLREKYKKLLQENPEKAEEIRIQSLAVEDDIRKQLSLQLFEHSPVLIESLNLIAYLDILLAKAIQAKEMQLCKPNISKLNTSYIGLFNPQVKEILKLKNKQFQAVDIILNDLPCLITGANMAGKTVLLKTVGLSQYLFQFGFYVPAQSADISMVDSILVSMGDEQSELNGLSSFASEMLNVNEIIKAVKSRKKVLALIDELARTTNPEEGKAIVNATIDILENNKVQSLITTHYNGLKTSCRKLRVKGLITEKLNKSLTIENINDYMDYSLIETNSETVPEEALRIAYLLGIDEELVKRAEEYYK